MQWNTARLRRLYVAYGIPLGVLMLGLLFTAYVTQTLHRIDNERQEERFSEIVGEAHTAIESGLATYLALLRAGAAFYSEMEDVSDLRFRRFTQHLRLERDYSGLLAFGFAQRIGAEDLPAFLEARRAEGEPGFQVWPDRPREDYVVVTYLEPLDGRNRPALGYDMFAEETRREAMELARDTGGPAASGKVDLVQEVDPARQAGFLLYVPVYEGLRAPQSVAERRQRLLGFVFGAFQAGILFRETLSQTVTREIAIDVYDGDPLAENFLYSSAPAANDLEPAFSSMRPLGFAGRRWTLAYRAMPSFEAAATSPAVQIMPLLGVIFSILLAGIMTSQVHARRAAQREARERRRAEAAVAEREQQLRQVLDNIYAFIGVLTPDGRIVEINQAPLERSAMVREAVIGRTFWEGPWWTGEAQADRDKVRLAVEKAAAGKVVRQDVHIQLGEVTRILDLQVAPLADADGTVRYIIPFGVDVTDRRQAEEHQAILMAELSHRVKNSLAVIQSLARQTGARAESLPAFLEAFQGRLMAMAAAHTLLIESGWRTAKVDTLIRRALKPHLVRRSEQLKLDVEPVYVSPELAQNLSLIIHELATNAVKYGALAVPGGRVVVEGRVRDDMFVLVWREESGRRISPPGKAGFGTTLLQALVSGRHRGEVGLEWKEDGLVCTIELPTGELRAVADQHNVFAEPVPGSPPPHRAAS
jgi:PAS domain S-box-containing protein